MQASEAEAVFVVDEGFGSQAAQYVARDDAVLVVAENLLDLVGCLCQARCFFRADGGGCFGGVAEAFAVFAGLVQCRMVTGARGVLFGFPDSSLQPPGVGLDQRRDDFTGGPGPMFGQCCCLDEDVELFDELEVAFAVQCFHYLRVGFLGIRNLIRGRSGGRQDP